MTAIAYPETPLGPLWAEMQGKKMQALHWGEAPVGAKTAEADDLISYFKKMSYSFEWNKFSPQGTPFQKRVWQALCDIPFGEIRTYGQLAQQLNSSPRAVGGAVGSNPIPILIPCHRVMGQGGKLTGFSAPGGLTTKRWLLQHEGIAWSA